MDALNASPDFVTQVQDTYAQIQRLRQGNASGTSGISAVCPTARIFHNSHVLQEAQEGTILNTPVRDETEEDISIETADRTLHAAVKEVAFHQTGRNILTFYLSERLRDRPDLPPTNFLDFAISSSDGGKAEYVCRTHTSEYSLPWKPSATEDFQAAGIENFEAVASGLMTTLVDNLTSAFPNKK